MSVTKSSLTQNIVVHVPKKQIVELNSRLKKETHQLVVALRRITKVEETRKLEHHQLADYQWNFFVIVIAWKTNW